MTFLPPAFEEPRRRWRRLDRVVRLIVLNWAAGMGVGALLGAGLIVCDFMGLRTLLGHANSAWAGSILFVGAFAFTFGGVVAASAAMRAGRDDDDEPRGGLRAPAFALASRTAR